MYRLPQKDMDKKIKENESFTSTLFAHMTINAIKCDTSMLSNPYMDIRQYMQDKPKREKANSEILNSFSTAMIKSAYESTREDIIKAIKRRNKWKIRYNSI